MEDDLNTPHLPSGTAVCTVLIGTTEDGATVAQLIFEALITSQPSTMIENYSKSNAMCSTGRCAVFVPILTPQWEESAMGQAAFEHARRLGKPIVPVIAVKKWKPTGWLGLIVAGRTFYRIFDRETAFQPFFDSNRMTDLRVEIEVSCRERSDERCLAFSRLPVNQLPPLRNGKKSRKERLRRRSSCARAN